MPKLSWHTEQRKISELVPFPDNPRRLTEKQYKDLKNSLEKFNLMSIPVIGLDNGIISGHQRLKILQALGRDDEVIDVRVPNRALTTAETAEAVLRENKNTGEWDFDILANWDEDLLKDVGFEDLPGLGKESLSQKIENLRPYNKAHVLISFDPEHFSAIKEAIDKIKKIPGIEIENGSN